ncbi:MAG: hypothetical protein V4608_14490 [Bacteroidota bacterium]
MLNKTKQFPSSNTSFSFWQNWLFYSSLVIAFTGIIFALCGASLLFSPYHNVFARIFWHQPNIPKEVMPFFGFVCGPAGATIACCYILLAYIAHYPFKRKERWARNSIIIAFGGWFIVDSAISVYYGVYFQVIILNSLSFLQKALPVIFTWKHFKINTSSNNGGPLA